MAEGNTAHYLQQRGWVHLFLYAWGHVERVAMDGDLMAFSISFSSACDK